MTLITDLQYFPPAILFKKSIECTNIELDIYDPFKKMSFRNRCVIAGSNGPVILSVPLQEGREQRKPMKEVRIDKKRRWQDQHWKTIVSCYNRSPWFQFYGDEMEELYKSEFELLADWNMACWKWVTGKLGFEIPTSFTTQNQASYDPAKYLDFRGQLMPSSIQKQFPISIKYRQVFEEKIGFLPHLSIIDLLFCEGKHAQSILRP
jgi:hypothetical protein